ncbi:MAG: hypothetical protein V7K97_25210 [Nostoc sp.]|uniref:hypothetical protein n=1 Tax=Nostoc sp. TaxID=1180 RepID=UPI002FFBE2A8
MKRFPSAELVVCASHHTPSWRQLSANSSLAGGLPNRIQELGVRSQSDFSRYVEKSTKNLTP